VFPPKADIVDCNPHPQRFKHAHVLAVEKWNGEYRMCADPELVAEHKQALDLVKRMEAEQRREKELRQRMGITAEVVMALEKKLLAHVFGDDYDQRGITMKDLRTPSIPERVEARNTTWPALEQKLRIASRFGNTLHFCDFLKTLKKQRHYQFHDIYRINKTTDELREIVRQYCADLEAEKLREIDELPFVGVKGKERMKKAAVKKRVKNDQLCFEMMELVKEVVGDRPFGEGEEAEHDEDDEDDEEKAEVVVPVHEAREGKEDGA
jgi:hypothetical protein